MQLHKLVSKNEQKTEMWARKPRPESSSNNNRCYCAIQFWRETFFPDFLFPNVSYWDKCVWGLTGPILKSFVHGYRYDIAPKSLFPVNEIVGYLEGIQSLQQPLRKTGVKDEVFSTLHTSSPFSPETSTPTQQEVNTKHLKLLVNFGIVNK